MQMACLSPSIDLELLDRKPFGFKHQMMGHPALELGNLARVLPALPPDQVMYSKGLRGLGTNFDRAHIDDQNGLGIEETIETIRTSNSYIAVRQPEVDPSFQDLHRALTDDIGQLMRRRGVGQAPTHAVIWLFIASPNAVTPFHFDRYSNFLFQFRGSKQVAVFEPWNDQVIRPEHYECYVARDERVMPWEDGMDRFARHFDFAPGEAIHIPHLGGHYVRNGPEDVSISMSIFFHTAETRRWNDALVMNDLLRRRLRPLGLAPRAVNSTQSLDGLKAGTLPLLKWSASMRQRLGRSRLAPNVDKQAPGARAD